MMKESASELYISLVIINKCLYSGTIMCIDAIIAMPKSFVF